MKQKNIRKEALFENIDVYSDDFPATDNSSSDATSNDDASFESSYETTRDLFDAAAFYLKPGRLFQAVSYLYAERKLFIFFLIHFVATMTAWGHFATIKWNEQVAAVPTTAPSYLWKRVTPTLEFGAMHAILFTMALIPLTMCRLGISSLSETSLNRYIPFNRALRMHIHLGYTMILTIVFATILFFTFFGKMCANGEQKFCDLLTSEIMSTGYGILVSLIIVGVTSYFRHRIPYEIFYIVHHLVFVMYLVTIAHTLDDVQRNGGRNRSQAFKWFSSTLILYICDRAALHMNHRFEARVVSASTVTGKRGSRMLLLKVRRPVLFHFKPGQFAFLRLQAIDPHWHPFSIASDPNSNYLEFYIECFKNTAWTGKLCNILNEGHGEDEDLDITMEVMGPYGTSLVSADKFSHGLAVGSGTGIVPILSLFNSHVRHLTRLSPESHFDDLERTQSFIRAMDEADSQRKGSFFGKLFRCCCRCLPNQDKKEFSKTTGDRIRERIAAAVSNQRVVESGCSKKMRRRNMIDMKTAAIRSTRSIYGIVALSLLPALGFALIGLSISWTTITVDLFDGMIASLQMGTVVFQGSFVFVSLFIWDSNGVLSLVDVVWCILMPFVDWFWALQLSDGRLKPSYLTTYCVFTGYMVLRLWSAAVSPRRGVGLTRKGISNRPLERFELVWVTRSATLVSEIYPEICDTWRVLVKAWGKENAEQACQISIYVTDTNAYDVESLQNELVGTELYEGGHVRFERPDFPRVLESHTLDMVSSRRYSYTMLAFCGSPKLASFINRCKISNDMIASITGYKNHQMEYVSESYGDSRKVEGADHYQCRAQHIEDSPSSYLTRRRNRLFAKSTMAEF